MNKNDTEANNLEAKVVWIIVNYLDFTLPSLPIVPSSFTVQMS